MCQQAEREAPDLSDLTDRILRFCHPEKIYLFGSRAAGTERPDSDVDVLVVWNEKAHLRPSLRRGMLLRNIGRVPYGLDLLVYTSAQLEEAMSCPLSFTAAAMKGAKLLYG